MDMNSRLMYVRKIAWAVAVLVTSAGVAFAAPGPGSRYATDAYPGFDSGEDLPKPEKKTPSWFSFFTSPAKDNASEQLSYARACEAAYEWRTARRAYDALVTYWPMAPEAVVAQKALADLYYTHYFDCEEAFREYKYLLDFYSSQCDYDSIVRRMYDVAQVMREEGKKIGFFRFSNATDVRRAFEAVVRAAPGSLFAPRAMLTAGELREEEGAYDKAIEVYETVRNIYPASKEAVEALHAEAAVRMRVLRAHEYNRARCQDTIWFLRMALDTRPDEAARADYQAWLEEATGVIEREAYQAARFYDSRTRTRRSAIRAYERFLARYPASKYAPAALARLGELQNGAPAAPVAGGAEKPDGAPSAQGGEPADTRSLWRKTCDFFGAYAWRSRVPDEARTVFVPTFRNESDVAEIGAVAARQLLREIQREGSFKIAAQDAAAIEVQGVIKGVSAVQLSYNRSSDRRHRENHATMKASISVIDKRKGKVLIDNRPYEAMTSFLSDDDTRARLREASGRLAEDLAMQIVDDLILFDWEK
ncbi:MAG TPA: hypothetical protein DER26_03760 [Verrucomicrobia bacterium]|nr:hypothetical protein [Verrucomicrobiota bacterium]